LKYSRGQKKVGQCFFAKVSLLFKPGLLNSILAKFLNKACPTFFCPRLNVKSYSCLVYRYGCYNIINTQTGKGRLWKTKFLKTLGRNLITCQLRHLYQFCLRNGFHLRRQNICNKYVLFSKWERRNDRVYHLYENQDFNVLKITNVTFKTDI
jgi:hypothetical protein